MRGARREPRACTLRHCPKNAAIAGVLVVMAPEATQFIDGHDVCPWSILRQRET